MAQAILRNIAVGLVATGLLAGCVEGTGGGPAPSAGPAKAAGKAGQAIDVEAPDLFQVTETALWDGRPSLGGIWVASPDAIDPERVLIVNTENGMSVTGALFRRERDNPGPRLQISSDAAEALGVLAGQPVTIRVTALRREDVAEDPAPVEAADAAPASEAPPADAEATAAAAAAALDAADAAATDGVTPAEAAPAEAAPARKTWKERRAEAKAAREAKKAAAAAAKAEAEAAKAAAAEAPGDNPVMTDVETVPLDAPAASPAPEAEVTEAPTPAAAGKTIQVGSFSKEENATRVVEQLAKIGISARVRKSGTEAKPVWSVLATGDAAMLNSIKSAGFADAYFLN